MNSPIYIEAKNIPAHLLCGYSGKTFKAMVVESITIPAEAGNWFEGSRDTYEGIELATGKTVPASDNVSAPWDGSRKARPVTLRPGFAIVRHSIFCGKDMGLTFYIHAANAAELLPAPQAALSSHEACVIEATCSLKSSYNGQDRYSMAQDNCRWDHNKAQYGLAPDEAFPTRPEWDAAKLSLIGKGLLNKAGAITVAGRNARRPR